MDDIPGAKGTCSHTIRGFYGPVGRRAGPMRTVGYCTRYALNQAGGLIIEVTARGRSEAEARRVAQGLLQTAVVRLAADMAPATRQAPVEPPPGSVAAEIIRARTASSAPHSDKDDPAPAPQPPSTQSAAK